METQILPPNVDQIVNDILDTLYGSDETLELRILEERDLIQLLKRELEGFTISKLKKILRNVGLPLTNLDTKSEYINRFVEYLGMLAPPNAEPRQVHMLLPLIGYPNLS